MNKERIARRIAAFFLFDFSFGLYLSSLILLGAVWLGLEQGSLLIWHILAALAVLAMIGATLLYFKFMHGLVRFWNA